MDNGPDYILTGNIIIIILLLMQLLARAQLCAKEGIFQDDDEKREGEEVKLFLPNLSNIDLYPIYMFIFT